MSSEPPEQRTQPESAAALPFAATLDALRARGAQRLDPVGFGFSEALARRAVAQPDAVRQLLERRLAQSVAHLERRLEQAEAAARDQLASGIAKFPDATKALRNHAYAGDSRGLHRLLARLEGQGSSGSLAALLAAFELQDTDPRGAEPAAPSLASSSPPAELKSMRLFRRTWSKLRAEQQLTNAIAQAPRQAGPLNSHALALQAIKWMRDNSPDYFEQFTSYVDGLLWLERSTVSAASTQKGATRTRASTRKKAD